MTSRVSSGSSRAESAVESTRSQNRTVSWRRSAEGIAARRAPLCRRRDKAKRRTALGAEPRARRVRRAAGGAGHVGADRRPAGAAEPGARADRGLAGGALHAAISFPVANGLPQPRARVEYDVQSRPTRATYSTPRRRSCHLLSRHPTICQPPSLPSCCRTPRLIQADRAHVRRKATLPVREPGASGFDSDTELAEGFSSERLTLPGRGRWVAGPAPTPGCGWA